MLYPVWPRIPSRWLAAVLTAMVVFAPPSRSLAHGGEQHASDRSNMPEADFVLADAMRLIAMQFSEVKDQAPLLGSTPEVQEKTTHAAEDAQRYFRTVKRRWAPDRAFQAFADDALAAWAEAEHAAREGNATALTEAVGVIGGTCKACHDVYNKPA